MGELSFLVGESCVEEFDEVLAECFACFCGSGFSGAIGVGILE